MVYHWKISDNYPEKLLGEYDRQQSFDRFELKQGKPLADPQECELDFRFSSTVKSLRNYDDLGNNALVPLISPAVATVIRETCPNDFQLVKANIECHDGCIDDFVVAVAVRTVNGLDHNKSKYSCLPGTKSIMKFEHAVYHDSCLQAFDAARDQEYLSNLLISKRLCQALKEFSGLGLYAQNEMNWV